jgi:hypothetical protein
MSDAAGLEFDGLDLGFDLGDLFEGQAEEAPPEPEPPVGWPNVELNQQGRPRELSHGGRPTLYTVPRVLAIVAALYRGASRADAARRAGVGVSTFYVWLQLGRRGHPAFAPLAEAVASVAEARGFNLLFRHVSQRRSFWKASP